MLLLAFAHLNALAGQHRLLVTLLVRSLYAGLSQCNACLPLMPSPDHVPCITGLELMHYMH